MAGLAGLDEQVATPSLGLSGQAGIALPPERLLDAAKMQYPILNNVDLNYKFNPKPNAGFLEFWPSDEPGSPERPRPQDFPMGKMGLEVYDPKTRPIDILGDVVSHHLIESDPTVSKYYNEFKAALTPDQKARLKEQYKHAQVEEGEKRPYEQWLERTGLPGYFRGYAFQQWDNPQEMYPPEQLKAFDEMMAYLRKPQTKTPSKLGKE